MRIKKFELTMPVKLFEHIKSRPYLMDGIWSFWEKTNGTFHHEYQCGSNADYVVEIFGNDATLIQEK